MNEIRNVCVYCASSTTVDAGYFHAADQLGRMLARRRINLVNGAGRTGLMRQLSDAALAEGGTVTGIIPHFMVERGWHHEHLTSLIETGSMHERKQLMAELCDAAIALPGGCGTLEELLEIITWKQLGLYSKPIVILNTNGYYDPLLVLLKQAVNQHFMQKEHGDIWRVAFTPAQAVELLFTTPRWNGKISNGVAR